MGIEVELTKVVRADPEVIWDLLGRPESWGSWWRDCDIARADDERPLREGSRLEVVLQPRSLRMTFRPVVDLLTEGKTLRLTHRSVLTQATATWYLQERPDTTLVRAEVVFNGIFPFLVTIAQQSSVVRTSLQRNLTGLKKAAERLV